MVGLLKFAWPAPEVLRAFPEAQVWRGHEAAIGYAYLPEGATPDGAVRLELTTDVAGAGAGLDAPFHYIVETDVTPEAEADLNAWYETEHLPGLASVPGTVRARRFVDRAGSPRYYACYDLAALEVFGCPAWLAVRATDWSSRVRPHFRNTRRTMFVRA